MVNNRRHENTIQDAIQFASSVYIVQGDRNFKKKIVDFRKIPS